MTYNAFVKEVIETVKHATRKEDEEYGGTIFNEKAMSKM